jgi:hypothetical protein
LFFPRLIGFGCCLVHNYFCTIHSVFAHLGPPPSVFLPIFLSLCFSGHPITRLPDLPTTPPPAPRLPPNFTQGHPIHPRISRGLHSAVAAKPSIRGPRRARFWRAGVEGHPIPGPPTRAVFAWWGGIHPRIGRGLLHFQFLCFCPLVFSWPIA